MATGQPSVDDFARLFRRHAASVAVITTTDPEGRPVGFTATSVVSVSAAPPIVAFTANRSSSSWPALRVGSGALIHFLAPEHAEVATLFATPGADRFGQASWRLDTHGLPLLDAVHTTARVRLQQSVTAGMSDLFLGLVESLEADEERDPLVYCDRDYRVVARSAVALTDVC